MAQSYNNPAGGLPSTVGSQIRTDYFNTKVLREDKELEFFSLLADTESMPKNMGKKIKRYHYMPLLSDRNINDQGIDAAGLSIANEVTITIIDTNVKNDNGEYITKFAIGTGANAVAALTAAKLEAENVFKVLGVFTVDYATTKAALEALVPAWIITELGAVNGTGNLYGSSRDVGKLTSAFPPLTENGGIVNGIGLSRIEIEGTFSRYGFFYSYTKESIDFDSDSELEMHLTREVINGAIEMQEDQLQIDILNAAGVIKYAGTATSVGTISGELGNVSLPTSEDLTKLDIALTFNKSPKTTTMITGSRMINTVTVRGGRLMYVGAELMPMLRKMTDNWGNPAFIDSHHYAAATKLVRGEVGKIGAFRIIEVPKMLHWAGVGSTVINNAGYRESNGKYNVYPMLVVGDKSFTTISFKTGKGRGNKFTTYHSEPKSAVSYANDKYGSTGFFSIEYYYGFMVLRPERIAIIKTVAEY